MIFLLVFQWSRTKKAFRFFFLAFYFCSISRSISAMAQQLAALYARVSTEEQTLDPQWLELRTFARQRGWQTLEFGDLACSGKHGARRPQWGELMRLARKRQISHVVVARLDRICRSTADLVLSIDELVSVGVSLVSLHEAIDTSTTAGRLYCHIFAALAEFERDLIRERTKAGVEVARLKGTRLGRPPARFDKLLVKQLYCEGYTNEAISNKTKVSLSVIKRFTLQLSRGAFE